MVSLCDERLYYISIIYILKLKLKFEKWIWVHSAGVQGVQPLSIPLAKELSEKNQTKDNCWVELVELNDDHSLMSSLDILLDKTTYFFDLIKK